MKNLIKKGFNGQDYWRKIENNNICNNCKKRKTILTEFFSDKKNRDNIKKVSKTTCNSCYCEICENENYKCSFSRLKMENRTFCKIKSHWHKCVKCNKKVHFSDFIGIWNIMPNIGHGGMCSKCLKHKGFIK